MSPSRSCFNRLTSSSTLPFRTVTLVHLGSCSVEDTTYLGRLFSRSAHSPCRDAHRAANHSSLRRPSSSAAVPSASAYSTLAHSSRSLPPYWLNQPPRLKPSSPSGSWTTPSSDTFVLMTIFPISVLLLTGVVSCDSRAARPASGWLPALGCRSRRWWIHRSVMKLGACKPPNSCPERCTYREGERHGAGRRVTVVGPVRSDLIARARAGDGGAFGE